MVYQLSREALFQETEDVLDAITHPAFIESMQKFRAQQNQARISFAETNLSISSLADRGVKFPAKMRISSRIFEGSKPTEADYVDVDRGLVIANKINAQDSLVKKLSDSHPAILEDLNEFVSAKTAPAVAPHQPNDLAKKEETEPVQLAGPWACACGGAATACGGAGGGTVVA